MRRLLTVFLLFAGLLLPVAPQVSVEVPRRLVLFFEVGEGSSLSSRDLILLYDSLLVKLSTATEDVVVLEQVDVATAPRTQTQYAEGTRRLGGDAWLRVKVTGDMQTLSIEAESYDLINDRKVLHTAFEETEPRGLDRRFWDDITSKVAGRYEKTPQRFVGRVLSAGEVILHAKPGTRIGGLSEEPLITDGDGEVRVSLLQFGTYTLDATLEGYYPLTRTFFLKDKKTTIDLEQKESSQVAAELYLNKMAYFGVEGLYYLYPDLLFVKIGVNTFLFSIALEDKDEYGWERERSFPLSHLNSLIGLYMARPDQFLRPYAALGLFARITHIPHNGLAIDPVSPWGFQGSLGVEISPHLQRRWFFELRPLAYFTRYPRIFEFSYASSSDSSRSPFLYAGNFVFDVLNINVGVRLRL
jgi:hypothetical protein